MSECKSNRVEFSYDGWFNNLMPFIKDEKIRLKLIKLKKENRITYTEHCGIESFFDNEGNTLDRDYIITTDKGSYVRPRREQEYNLCFQYIPAKRTIKGHEYITLKIDD